MRLHRLEATAFGPFVDTVTVDFDRLSSAGLFLLSGPTGAGKTSVLDAVCFALYGDVPGDRSAAKRLRSDQATPAVATRVTLEATLGGRRFRITRSPSWERPKKRGTGTTTQQASVVLQERRGDEWQTLSTRLDEAGHLVTGLLGMTLTQFTQVAMLPQGRFQAFLRAKADERKELLQRLFRTERFTDVERWLRDRRLELRARSASVHQRVADVVSRISETTDTPLPADWDIHDLTLPAADGELTGWVTGLADAARVDQETAAASAATALAEEKTARDALDEARRLAAFRERVQQAAAEHADLLAGAEEHDLAVAAVEAAGRAAAVVPVDELTTRARAAHEDAERAAPAGTDLESASTVLAGLEERLAAAKLLLPRQERLRGVASELSAVAQERLELSERTTALAERRAALPATIVALRGDLADARAAVAELPALQRRLDAHAAVEELGVALAEARSRHAAARERALALRERALDVRQARLEGMAAELAGALAVGADCPVCGSVDHPRKAVPASGAPDAEAERAAQKAADDASVEEHARDGRVRDVVTRLELARAQAGDDAEVATLEEDLDRLSTLAARAPHLEDALGAAELELEELGSRIAAAEARLAELDTSTRHLSGERDRLAEAVRDALAGTGATDVEALVHHLADKLAAARSDVERLQELQQARRTLAEAEVALTTACRRAGFTAAEDARAAALDTAVVDELTATIKHHDRRLAAVGAILAERGADDVLRRPAPDVDAMAAAHTSALDRLGAAQAAVSRAVSRLARITALQSELAEQITAWEPLRADLEVTTRLAAFAEGKSSDNRLQMSLSAYVVAYRLTQVVAAANERLAVMSDQRYSLEHSAARAAGDRRGGLALLVRDDWSGESRDPATLSGGETFVVSLALALGLADVIMQEAGGALLETLFVDEGFGSLDADTLDDVLDVLDGLRDGGRVVGVVSHVAEMRDRIPAQLMVTKRREGSTLRVQGAPASGG
ncbi:AAA family ATPase [Nocardioides sp. DS6]|uniref:Nuclease SbcCD subunit C n=1 Tax=Nocardioides eburneus TaxID=3231482 RepID=A0ABV3T3J3_9ACTN